MILVDIGRGLFMLEMDMKQAKIIYLFTFTHKAWTFLYIWYCFGKGKESGCYLFGDNVMSQMSVTKLPKLIHVTAYHNLIYDRLE